MGVDGLNVYARLELLHTGVKSYRLKLAWIWLGRGATPPPWLVNLFYKVISSLRWIFRGKYAMLLTIVLICYYFTPPGVFLVPSSAAFIRNVNLLLKNICKTHDSWIYLVKTHLKFTKVIIAYLDWANHNPSNSQKLKKG